MKLFTTKIEREHHWEKVIQDWRSSGEKINLFCQTRNITTSSFYQWRNRLFPELKTKLKANSKSTTIAPSFLPVEITTNQPYQQALILNLPNGCWISLTPNFDEMTLTRLIKVMGGKDANVTRC